MIFFSYDNKSVFKYLFLKKDHDCWANEKRVLDHQSLCQYQIVGAFSTKKNYLRNSTTPGKGFTASPRERPPPSLLLAKASKRAGGPFRWVNRSLRIFPRKWVTATFFNDTILFYRQCTNKDGDAGKKREVVNRFLRTMVLVLLEKCMIKSYNYCNRTHSIRFWKKYF